MTFCWPAAVGAALIFTPMSAAAVDAAPASPPRSMLPSHRWISRLTLVRQGSRLFLKSGNDSVELYAAEKPETVRLASGARLDAGRWRESTSKPAILRRDGSRIVIDLNARFEEWLKEDGVWGGHANANQLRYMDKSAGGISGELVNPVPAGDHWLAIVWWHAMGPSGEPVYFQHLVRLDQNGTLKPIRPLTPPGQVLGLTDDCRLFHFRDQILLYRPGAVVELTRDGAESAIYTKLPPNVYPAALEGGRYWLLVPSESEHERAIHVLDLLERQARRVPMPAASGLERAYPTLVHADPATGEAIVAWRSYTSERADVYLINVRKSTARRSGRPYLTRLIMRWHGIDVAGFDNEFDCYDKRTGRLLKRLADPSAAAPPT